MKKLYLLRHADAQNGPDDRTRALTAQGLIQAENLGLYMRRHQMKPDAVFCSDARRTVMTVENMAAQWGWTVPLKQEGGLYLATAGDLLAFIHGQLPEEANAALLIAHNPGIAELALRLSQSEKLARHGYPPATLTEILCESKNWKDVSPHNCRGGQVFTAGPERQIS